MRLNTENVQFSSLAGVPEKARLAGKYCVMWDNQGNVETFMKYSAQNSIFALDRELIAVALGRKTNEEVADSLRKHVVLNAKFGTNLTISCGNLKPNFLYDLKTDIYNALEINSFDKFRQYDNYMKIVKDEENTSLTGD